MALMCQGGVSPVGRKAMYMIVVPKFLEGFEVKYSRGTGESKFTMHRDTIYHHECGVKVFKRKHYNYSRYHVTTKEERHVQNCFFSQDHPLGNSADSCTIDSEDFPGDILKRSRSEDDSLLCFSESFEFAIDTLIEAIDKQGFPKEQKDNDSSPGTAIKEEPFTMSTSHFAR
jgi:hypothetical protein